jgi:hypothetical protein
MMPHLPYPRRSFSSEPAPAPAGVDLQSQFEAILDTVWKAEADWRFMDRLDMAMQRRRETSVKG